MADNLRQISLTIDTDRFTATDFAGRQNPSLSVVNGDTLLLAVQFLRLNATTGALEALNLSAGGAPQALRCTVRQTRDPDADLLTFQDAYNQGDLPAAEDLTTGHVTWKIAFNSDNLDDLFTAGVETVDVWIELVYLSAGGIPQTLFQRQITVAEQLDDGAVGDPPPSSPTYLTATEIAAAYVGKNLYDAYTVLAADADNTPAALALAASTVVGRKASGGIVALTGADLATIIGSVTPAAHALDGALHTVAGLTTGHFLKATGATTFGFAAHGLSYGDVGAAAASHAHAATDITSGTLDGDRLPGLSSGKKGGVPATGTPSGLFLKDDGTWASAGVAAHAMLSATHTDATVGTCTRGDLIVGIGASPTWTRYAIAVPAANVRNVFGIDNGETEPTWKTALDDTNPAAVAESTAAAPGTSLVFAHRDHAHACPATWAATAHNLLATTHGDTLADTVIAGDLLIGNATPKWARLAAGAQYYVLGMGASLPAWALLTNNNVDAAAAIARSKLAAGTADHVVINAASTGVFSSEAQLAVARGGTGVATAAANYAFMGPTSGAAAAPAFRALVAADANTIDGLTSYLLLSDTSDTTYTGKNYFLPRVVEATGATTKLLLHGNGTDGATTITDDVGKTITVVGNAQIDTAQYKFGGASILFDGTGDCVYAGASADWSFTGNCYIDFWMCSSGSYTTAKYLCCIMDPSDNSPWIGVCVNNTLGAGHFGIGLLLDNGSSTLNLTYGSNGALTDGAWHHIEIGRSGSTWYLFTDGVQRASGTLSGTFDLSSRNFVVGAYNIAGTYSFSGWIDEFHIVNGAAGHTSGFTPPAVEYVYSALSTVLQLQTLISGGAASVDNQIARFDGTSGCWLQGSGGPTISDTGILAVDHIAQLTTSPAHGVVFDNAVSVPSTLTVRGTSGTDTLTLAHDETDAIFKTTDGSFKFQTDEGTNTDTYLDILSKGTGYSGWVRLYGGIANGSVLSIDKASLDNPNEELEIQPGATNAYGLGLFKLSNSGNTRELHIYGYRAADSLRKLEIGCGVDAADTASFDGLSNYAFDGNLLPLADATYYLGKNDDDTPAAWKGVILKDTTNGKYYRVEVISGVVTATDLTD